MEKVILATTSPYRKEIFASLKIPFKVVASNVDESQLERNNPKELVKELAKMKAKAVSKNYKDNIVIGFDSVGFFEGKILEKPKSKEEAFKRLQSLSGKSHWHYTGIYITNNKLDRAVSKVNETEIFMRKYSDKEIEAYLEKEVEFKNFALGYDTEKCLSASFIERIKGNHLNLKGIPLSPVIIMLEEVGYNNQA